LRVNSCNLTVTAGTSRELSANPVGIGRDLSAIGRDLSAINAGTGRDLSYPQKPISPKQKTNDR
jgi:hypothetical protein